MTGTMVPLPIHELKTWPAPFQDIWDGKKKHEIREDDRNFKVGDLLKLREFEPHEPCAGSGRVWDNGDKTDCGCAAPHGRYTGRVLEAEVTYKTKGGEWGLPEELCVLSVRILKGGVPSVAPTKSTGIKCYDKAAPDEPLFVLRAQDLTSPQVICEWIKLNVETCSHAKLRAALESALAMSSYGRVYGMDGGFETKRKRAD